MLLGAGSAIHTQRWANGLAEEGLDVLCVSQHDFLPAGWDARVRRARLPRSGLGGYFLNGGTVARLFRRDGCRLMNAHYATGYGVLAARSGVRPRIVSVWGSDVYDFPQGSSVHRGLVRQVLTGADAVASTSLAMARQVEQVLAGAPLRRPIAITPFGVDVERFAPLATAAARPRDAWVIGTVKALAPKYGVDTLLRAFARLPSCHDGLPLRLSIVGDGPQRAELQELAAALDVHERVEFVGAVAHDEVPRQLQRFDVYAAASRLDSESFGVAVVEASACGLPVVVTRVGGLPEVVREGETGLIVEREDAEALAAALLRLLCDAALRRRLGDAGRAWVQSQFEWRACVRRMRQAYEAVLEPAMRPAYPPDEGPR